MNHVFCLGNSDIQDEDPDLEDAEDEVEEEEEEEEDRNFHEISKVIFWGACCWIGHCLLHFFCNEKNWDVGMCEGKNDR